MGRCGAAVCVRPRVFSLQASGIRTVERKGAPLAEGVLPAALALAFALALGHRPLALARVAEVLRPAETSGRATAREHRGAKWNGL